MNWIDLSEEYGDIRGSRTNDKSWRAKGGAWVVKNNGYWFGISFLDRIDFEISQEEFDNANTDNNDLKQFISLVSIIDPNNGWFELGMEIMNSREDYQDKAKKINLIEDVELRAATWAAEYMFSFGAGGELKCFYSSSPAVCGADAFRYAEMLINDSEALQRDLERMKNFRY